jgi:hypothetical protein
MTPEEIADLLGPASVTIAPWVRNIGFYDLDERIARALG